MIEAKVVIYLGNTAFYANVWLMHWETTFGYCALHDYKKTNKLFFSIFILHLSSSRESETAIALTMGIQRAEVWTVPFSTVNEI